MCTCKLWGQACGTALTLGHKTLPRNRNPLTAKMSCPQKPLLTGFNQFKERFNAPKSTIFIFQLNSFLLKRKMQGSKRPFTKGTGQAP